MIPSYSDELCDLLPDSPLLREAFRTVRRSRSEKYFKAIDGLMPTWANALSILFGAEYFVAVNMAAMDTIFEEKATSQQLIALQNEVDALTLPDQASAFLDDSEAAHTDLLEAAKIHIAFITAIGYQRLQTSADPTLANIWLPLWRNRVSLHNIAQVEACQIAMQPTLYTPPSFSAFNDIIGYYLDHFAYSGAISIAVTGIVPFIQNVDHDLLVGVVSLGEQLEGLYRLVEDNFFDPSETMNLISYIFASEQHITIADAKNALLDDPDSAARISEQLKQAQAALIEYDQRATAEIVSAYYSEPLAAFADVLLDTAIRLSTMGRAMRS